MKLSKRLGTVASMVTQGNTVADVGCDHGFVPIWLVENGVSPAAIAADVRPGPLERAREHIRECGLESRIEARLSDGLNKFKPGEAETLVMSGIGGQLMIRILKADYETAVSFRELILSPQSELELVRKYLHENGFLIDYEHILKEDGKFYFIFHVTPKPDLRRWSEEELRFGKNCCLQDKEALLEYLEWEKGQCRQVLNGLESGPKTEKTQERIEQLHQAVGYAEKKQRAMEEYIDEVQ